MASNADGGPGNRPASVQEINKLPRHQCGRCLIVSVAIMLNEQPSGDWFCRNLVACRKRAHNLGLPKWVDIDE